MPDMLPPCQPPPHHHPNPCQLFHPPTPLLFLDALQLSCLPLTDDKDFQINLIISSMSNRLGGERTKGERHESPAVATRLRVAEERDTCIIKVLCITNAFLLFLPCSPTHHQQRQQCFPFPLAHSNTQPGKGFLCKHS